MLKGAVGFVDFLGQKGIWKNHDPNLVLSNIRKLREVVKHHQTSGNNYLKAKAKAGAPVIKLETVFISDTICLFCWYESPEDPNNKLCALVYILGKIIAELVREAALITPPRSLRGCISVGDFNFDDDIIIGEAVDEAATYHELADGAFTFLAPSAKNCLEEAARESGMDKEELSLFVDYSVSVKERSKDYKINSYDVPSLNPLAGEDKTNQTKIIDGMLESFDNSNKDVQRKKNNTDE